MMLRRTDFLTVAGAAAATALVPRAARAQSDAPVRIGALTIDPAAEAYYGQEMGFFKNAGLNVVISEFTSGNAAANAVAGGALDIGICDAVSMATAHSRGIPLVYLAPATVFTKAAQASMIVVLNNSSIKTAKDFNGKIVASNGIKNIVEIPTDAWIENNGGDPKTVKFVEMPVPAMSAAVEEGRIDVAIVSEPFITTALATGKFRVLSLADKNVAPSFLYSGWATTVDWAQKHPDLARKFITAMTETAKWANANHPQSALMLTKISKVSPDVANRMGRSYYGEKFDAALYQPVIDACAKYGAIAKSFPATEVISPLALR